MRAKYYLLFVVLHAFMFINTSHVFADHVMGGTFTYSYLGQSKYAIEFVAYRDCKGIPLDASLSYSIRGSTGGSTTSKTIKLTQKISKLASSIANCTSTTYCIDKGMYRDTITLGSDTVGYHIWLNRCCRNNSILNINNPGSTALLWYGFIPADKYKNSSPTLVKDVAPDICVNKTNIFNPGFYDADGDSLSFSLVASYTGGTPPSSLTTVSYKSGYSINYPFGTSSPAIKIDAVTGEITATAKNTGNYVVGVEVAEYRVDPVSKKAKYMGKMRVDIQFVVKTCGSGSAVNPDPAFITDTNGYSRTVEVGQKLCFTIEGVDTTQYNNSYDSLWLTASGSMLGKVNGFPKPFATFTGDTATKKVTAEFCWEPSCEHVTYTSPHVVVFRLADQGCNTVERSYSIYVRSKTSGVPVLNCVSVTGKNQNTLYWTPIAADSIFNSYMIYRKKMPSGSFTKVRTITTRTTTSWTDSSASGNQDTAYQYFITSTNSCAVEVKATDTLQTVLLSSNKLASGVTELSWNGMHSKIKDTFLISLDTGSGFVPWVWTTQKKYSVSYCDINFKALVQHYNKTAACYGTSNPSDTLTPDTTKPVAGVFLNATVVSKNEIGIAFKVSTSDDVKHYNIYRSVNGGSYSKIGTAKPDNGSTIYYYDTTVNADTNLYCYNVGAEDYCGNLVMYSPHCVVKLTAEAGNLNVKLKWSGYSGYSVNKQKVQKFNGTDWVDIASLSINSSSYIDTDVTCATYKYRLISEELNGNMQSSYSNVVEVTPFDTVLPAAPLTISATVNSNTEIEVTLKNSKEDDVKKYIIYEWKNGTGPKTIDTIRAVSGTVSYTRKTGVNTASDIYYYAVKALDSCGNRSGYNKIGTVKLDVKAGNRSANLTWNAPLNYPVSKYYIYRKKGTATSFTLADSTTTDTFYNDKGLACSTDFTYMILAKSTSAYFTKTGSNNINSNIVKVTVFDTVAPDRPFITVASVKNSTSIDVTFNSSTDKDVKKYFIYTSENGGAYKKADSVTNNGSATYTYTYSGINPLKNSYCFYIKAIDTCAGNLSMAGDTHCVVQLTGVAGNLAANLSWSAYKGFTTGKYYIQKNVSGSWATIDSVSAATLIYTDVKSLRCNYYEQYRVMAKKAGSSIVSYSDTVVIKPFDTVAPQQVNILRATVVDGSTITLEFDTVADLDVNRYFIYVKKNSGTFSKLATITNPTTNPVTYKHTSINALADTFYYQVKALDSCSDNISKNTETHRAMQLNGVAQNYANSLQWSAYNGFGIKNYIVQRLQSSAWTDLDTLANTVLNYTDGPIPCNQTQYYRIKALEDGGDGKWSISDTIALKPFDTIKPAPPVLTYATYVAGDKIKLNWNRSASNDVRAYIVYRKNASGTLKAIDTVGDVNSYVDTLQSAAPLQYCYAVRAMDSCVNNIGAYSVTHCPVNMVADTNLCNQKIYIDWTAYTGWKSVNKYNIYKAEQGGMEAYYTSVAGTVLAYIDTVIDYTKTYCYRIEAVPDSNSFTSFSASSCDKTYEPDVPHILSASKIVTSQTAGEVLLQWTSVFGKRFYDHYNIYHKAEGDADFTLLKGNIPINQYSYTHKGINTADEDHSYKITIVDSCGNNKTLYSPEHTTMNLQVNVGQLLHKIKWTLYIGFAVDTYYVERLEGGIFKTLLSVQTDTNVLIFPAPCNYNIFYRIKAVDADGNYAYSDTVGRQAIDTIPSNSATLLNATVNSGTEAQVDFIGADSADVYQYVIQRANDGVWGTAGTIDFTSAGDKHTFIDITNTLDEYLCYTVLTLDSCLNVSLSDTFCVPQLKGTPMNQANMLNWHPYKGYSINAYNIYKWQNNAWKFLSKVNATDTTFYEDTLHCDLPNHYKIEAVGSDGKYVSFSDSVTLTPFDTILPPAPTLRYVNVNDDQTVEVAWRYDNKSDVKYFEIWRSDDGVNYDITGATIFDSVYTDYLAQPATNKTSYYVVAIDSCDVLHKSIPSDTDVVSFAKLTNGSCIPMIFLDWSNYNGFASGTNKIEVYRREQSATSWLKVATLPANSTSYKDTVPDENITYCYKLVSLSNSENFFASSGTFCYKPWIFPKPDSALMVYTTVTKTGATNGEVFIEWPAYDGVSDTFARGYRLYHRSSNSGAFSVIYDVKDLTKTSFTHKNINTSTAANEYYVAVYNLCDKEGSASINHKTIDLKVKNLNLQAQLSWNKYSGETVTKYELYKKTNAGPYVLFTTLTAADTSISDTSLICKQHYVYELRAYLKNGKISISDTLGIDAFDDTPPPAADVFYATTDITDKTGGRILMRFQGNIEKNRNSFKLFRSVNGGAYTLYQTITDLTLVQDISDDGLNTADDVYSYYFTSTDSCGNESMPSDTHTIIHLKVKAYSEYIKVDWSHYKGFKNWNYLLERSMNGGPFVQIGTLSSATKIYIDSAVKCHQFYTYRLKAIENGTPYFSVSNTAGDTAFETVLPVPPVIKRVTVTSTGVLNGSIHIEWNASVSKDAAIYFIESSEDGISWKPASPQLISLSFDDMNLNTAEKSYYYRIWVTDSCGNVSATPSVYHRSVLLEAEPGNQQVNLHWNNYSGWPVKAYKVYKNNAYLATVPGTQTLFTDTFVLCVNYYRYYVEAVSALDTNVISVSNTDSTMPWDKIAPRTPYLKTVTVFVPNNEVRLEWNASTSFDVKQYFIYLKDAKTGKQQLIDSTTDLFYIHRSEITQPDCYVVLAGDHCSNKSKPSNFGCIIVVDAKNGDGYNELKWNAYINWPNGVAGYNIYKNEDKQGWLQIANTQQLNYTDKELGDDVIDYCYKVEAIEKPGGYNATSMSTVDCAHQNPIVHIPNAFTPDYSLELNDGFGPQGMYIRTYDMKIFNRWGQVVYETTKGEKWDGKLSTGEFAPVDIYMYYITVKGYNKGDKHFSGNVMILR